MIVQNLMENGVICCDYILSSVLDVKVDRKPQLLGQGTKQTTTSKMLTYDRVHARYMVCNLKRPNLCLIDHSKLKFLYTTSQLYLFILFIFLILSLSFAE